MAFNTPSKLAIIKQKPTNPSTKVWTRPGDWPTVTDTAGEVQFLASDVLNATYNLQTEFIKPAAQNLYIDWGDGTTNTISTNTAVYTSHTYAVGTGTVCSRGYTTFKIRVYVDSGATIDVCKFRAQGYNGTAATEEYTSGNPCGLLEAYYGDNTLPTLGMKEYFRDTIILVTFSYLEYVKCPETMTYNQGLLQTFSTGSSDGCPVLAKVVLPTNTGATLMIVNTTFAGCVSLLEQIFPTNMLVDNILAAFSGCNQLRSVVLPPNMDTCTSIASAFQNCNALGSIDLPALPACIGYNNAFQNCSSLTSFVLKSFTSTALTINFSTMFSGCISLVNVNLPSTVVAGTVLNLANTFSTCRSLLTITLPEVDINSLSNTFSSCSNLQSITLPTSCPSLTTMADAFSSCTSLPEITLPTTVTSGTISLSTTFSTCSSISSITIPSSYNINTLASTFLNCTNLVTCILPNNAQDSITTCLSTFSGCSNLINLTLPTSMTGVTSLSTAFLNCKSLQSVVLPSPMNSCASMVTIFSGCTSLISATFPTSMTGLILTGFSNPVAGCTSLKNLVLPATTSTAPTSIPLSNAITASLETITFPTTQLTAITTLNNLFNYFPGLTGAYNVDKLGNNSAAAVVYLIGTNIMGGNNGGARRLLSLDFTCKFSTFVFVGTVTKPMALNSLRLRNAGTGQYAGTTPQINVSYTSLGTAALNQLFTDLPTVTSKTINITGTPGAATCTRSIATTKGWSITG